MIKLSLPATALFLCIAWLILLFSKLSHSIFQPGVLFSWFISEGLVFYKDFANMHFPLSTFIVYPFFLLSNWNLEIEPTMSLILGIGTLLVIYLITIQFLSKTRIIASLLFFSISFYYFSTAIQYSLEAVIGFFTAILIYVLTSILKTNKKVSGYNLFFCGVLIGLAELSGQIATLTLGAFALFVIYFTKKIKYLLLGTLLPVIILLIYLTKNNGFTEFLNQNIFYYLNYIRLARVGSPLEGLPWQDIVFFYAPLLSNLPLAFQKKMLSISYGKLQLTLVAMAILSIPSVVFSVFHPHHFLFILPVLSILLGFAFDGLKAKSYLKRAVIFATFLYIIYQTFTSILPWYWERLTAPKKYGVANDVLPGTSMYEATEWVKNNTQREDRILVAGDGMFYFRAERLPSTNRQTVLPWHYKPIDQTSQIIRSARPDYWIIDVNYLKRLSVPWGWNSPEITEFINEELNACYQKVTNFSEWEIWKKQCS